MQNNHHHREFRLQIMLNESEIAAIDEWRFNHRMPNRSEAFRELLRRGLTATEPADKIQ